MKSNNTKIICEIASAHGGDLIKLKELMSAADESKSDYLKLQIFDYPSLVAKENKNFESLRTIQLSLDDWHDAFTYAEKLRIQIILEVYDRKSLEFTNNYQFIFGYKIPTSDLVDLKFIEEISIVEKNIFLAVGGATYDEIAAAVNYLNVLNAPKPVLMHGIQSFPTLLEDSLLNKITWLKNTFQCEVGYADHIDAEETELSRTISCMAIAAGANIIEKHITLERKAKGFDYYSALNPDEFSSFVKHVRRVEMSLGHEIGAFLNQAETEYRNKMKKFAVTLNRVEEGARLADIDFIYQRTSIAGLTIMQISEKKNYKTICSIEAGSVLLESMIG
jgi:N,N'-diacetyllegionaminate synthase